MPGGKLKVNIDPQNNIHITGPVDRIMEGRFTEDLLNDLKNPVS